MAFIDKNFQYARNLLLEGVDCISAADDVDFYRTAAGVAADIGDAGLLNMLISKGLACAPYDADLRYLAARVCLGVNKSAEAQEHLEIAVNMKPRFLEAMYRLAVLYINDHKLLRAERILLRLLELKPGFPGLHGELGRLYIFKGEYERSLTHYRQALRGQYQAPMLSSLASAQRRLGRFKDASMSLRRSMALDPSIAGGYYNYGNLTRETAEAAAASQAFRRAAVISPKDGTIRWNLALALLAEGRLREGFEEYEWRWQHKSFPSRRRNFAQPEWGGDPLAGRTLFVHAEQGIGDVLQFLRFVPEIVRLARPAGEPGRVIVEVHPELMDLCRPNMPDSGELAPRLLGQEPPFDCHLALMSLPRMLGVENVRQLPRPPYIFAKQLNDVHVPEIDEKCLNVGIVWGGNPDFQDDSKRSTSLEYYLPILNTPGVRFFCLQKGKREKDTENAPSSLILLNKRIGDFSETASIIEKLDITITTCTSVAHLAGAMNCPTWVLLSHAPDWRWMYAAQESAWYPNARLFRQSIPGDWPGVFNAVGDALKMEVERRDRM